MKIKNSNGMEIADILDSGNLDGRVLLADARLEGQDLQTAKLSNICFQGGNFDDCLFDRSEALTEALIPGTASS